MAIAVAVVPALLGIVGSLFNREARAPRELRTLNHLVESLSKSPEGSDARDAISTLTADYAREVAPALLHRPKLNKSNVALSVVLAVITLFAMYGLLAWVGASGEGFWNVAAIAVTVIVGLFLLVINAASVGTWYNSPSESKSGGTKTPRS